MVGSISVTGASYTPAGSVSVTPKVTGASYTPAGTVSVTTNPTFSGSEVTSVSGGNWDFHIRANSYSGAGKRYDTAYAGTNTTHSNEGDGYAPLTMANSLADRTRDTITHSGHTHSVTAKGTISGGAYSFKGTAATITPTVTATGSFTGTKATITPSATFTGNSNTTSSVTVTGSFSGTRTTTESTGSGTSVDKMPPYVVEYCWKRTA